MKRRRTECRFVDIEARMSESEDEDEEDQDFLGEVEPTAKNQHAPSRDLAENNNNSKRGWSNLVASLEERFSGSRTTHGSAERSHGIEYLARNPELAAAIDNITRSPNEDRPIKDPPELGQWVQVRRGTYKGDVGYVLSVVAPEVHLLLIPCLTPLDQSHSSHTRPALKLFGHEPLLQYGDNEPHEKVFSLGNHRIEYCLIVKSYTFDSISTPVSTIPLQSFVLFHDSRHPKIPRSSFPRPLEWNFTENEKVYIIDFNPRKLAHISTFRDDSVELETDEGIVVVPWVSICKAIEVGDFVEVTGGLQKDQRGWVDEVNYSIQLVNIIRMADEGKPFSDETFQEHFNLLKHADVPFVLGLHPRPADALPRTQRPPWIDVEILITRGHVMKGYPGVVKDVVCNQATPSGLGVLVQITSLDSSAPFRRIVVDYDHVVEASRGVQLHHFRPPKTELFMPRNSQAPKSSPALIHPPPLNSPPLNSPGKATPIPESCLPCSPAWDPSSRTPQPYLNTSCANLASPSQSDALLDPPELSCASSQLVHPEHILLDPRLVNVKLWVVVEGGEYKSKKEITAFITSTDGRLSFHRQKYKTLEYLSPDWVTPKHPNPKRENGLLIVIKGEHFGKYARRIYHRFVGDVTIAILAVMNRVEGQVDTLTGGRLEMDASHLCVCEEGIEERKQNDQLMLALRNNAREKRAK